MLLVDALFFVYVYLLTRWFFGHGEVIAEKQGVLTYKTSFPT